MSSSTSGRSAGVEVENVLLKTKVRYGEISYNDEDVLQRKDGWRPSERQAWIVMEELKPYAARTVTFFRTGDDPVVKSFYDKRLLRSTVLARHFLEAWRRTIRRSRCLICMFCCLHFCCLCMTCACLKHWRYKTWLAASVSYEVGAVIGSEAVNF